MVAHDLLFFFRMNKRKEKRPTNQIVTCQPVSLPKTSPECAQDRKRKSPSSPSFRLPFRLSPLFSPVKVSQFWKDETDASMLAEPSFFRWKNKPTWTKILPRWVQAHSQDGSQSSQSPSSKSFNQTVRNTTASPSLK